MTGVSISKKLATTVGPTEFAQQQQQQQQQQKQHTYGIYLDKQTKTWLTDNNSTAGFANTSLHVYNQSFTSSWDSCFFLSFSSYHSHRFIPHKESSHQNCQVGFRNMLMNKNMYTMVQSTNTHIGHHWFMHAHICVCVCACMRTGRQTYDICK